MIYIKTSKISFQIIKMHYRLGYKIRENDKKMIEIHNYRYIHGNIEQPQEYYDNMYYLYL